MTIKTTPIGSFVFCRFFIVKFFSDDGWNNFKQKFSFVFQELVQKNELFALRLVFFIFLFVDTWKLNCRKNVTYGLKAKMSQPTSLLREFFNIRNFQWKKLSEKNDLLSLNFFVRLLVNFIRLSCLNCNLVVTDLSRKSWTNR
jgi:hypothetical protein